MDAAKDWKRELSFPINYDSDQSGEDWDDRDVVVMRSTKSSSYLLRDGGDGSEADLLGTTPPREIQRGKVKKKPFMAGLIKSLSGNSKPPPYQQSPSVGSDRVRRAGRQMKRRSERDMKVDVAQAQARADSLPSPAQSPAVPTLVESCNRFMSLTSRLKCRSQFAEEEEEPALRRGGSDLTCVEEAKRASFHQTFSLLINMGNMEKGCKRTISREEQVWQNELKDLIWLELQARLSGRTLAQQDAFLCARRAAVPAVLQNIRDYSFVNPHPCKASGLHGSQEGLTTDGEGDDQASSEELLLVGCLSLNCRRCSDAVGAALREVGTLLDSLDAAATLYPSGTAMTADHPLMATQLFQNRVKAMCLWYNTSRYLRMKVVAVRRMLRTMRLKGIKAQRRRHAFGSTDSDLSRQSSERRECTVRFNCPLSATPTDSSGSDGSCPRADGNQCTSSDEVDHATERDEDAVPTTPASKSESSDTHESHGTHESHEADEEHDSDEADEIGDLCGPYATADTVASSESGYGSSRELENHAHEDDLFDLGDLDDLAKLRLLGKCPVSLYRDYHHEMLKTQGVRRCMMFMNKMRLHVLHKVLDTLEKPDALSSEEGSSSPSPGAGPAPAEVFADAAEAPEPATPASQREEQLRQYERRRYGCWSEETLSMRLPSYRNHFLLLSSICMEAVHDYLSLRLEDRPENPSCLTVKQLIHELKEGLDIATEMRAAYARHIAVALAGHAAGQSARRALLAIVRTYDGTVETVLKQYLSYLRTMSAVERMSRWALQAEWAFAARLARRGRSAASLAPVTFAEIACNQLNRILNEFDAKFKDVQRREKEETSLDNDRYLVFTICREAQAIYASEREATLQAAQWARALAARLARAPPPAYQAERAALFECLMSLCSRIVQHTSYIMARSEPAELDAPPLEQEAMAARVRELLLQVYRLGFELHRELHKFAQAPFKESPSHGVQPRERPASLQPPMRRAGPRRRRPETVLVHESVNPLVGSETQVHRELQRFMAEQRGPARRGRPRLLRPDSVADDPDERLFENFPDGQTQPSIEQILIGSGAVGGAAEAAALDPAHSAAAAWAARAARAVVLFARCWMRFVVQRCDKGRGLRPRWASQGLEFLMLACDPCNTKHLTDEEFEELKKEMDGCISHVIGSRSARPGVDSPDPTRRARATPPAIAPRQSPLVCSPPAVERPGAGAGGAGGAEGAPPPPTPPVEPDPLLSFHGCEHKAHSLRVSSAVRALDVRRDAQLSGERRVGRALGAAAAGFEPKLRQLNFKWQRGLKIGQGTFGKVYTVVNTESGQLLAMKELSIGAGAGDRRALQRAANELQVLEGIVHPHLVRYYGCELHREEMLIFMELCVEGSLEALVATAGALAEPTTRRYARQLLSAVAELHARTIAHRDIKSGNIFLTNEGHCLKLGDFGSAVKIRANTTAAGELQGYVGTQAYMAPEVFMKSTGHGRAADVWSLGCVVTEMATGKRPFSEYDSNYQIMFVVGMGRRPTIPETLSEEGQQFCLACLTHEPEQRPRAEELMLHHFLMVKADDEDCNCEPAFLIS